MKKIAIFISTISIALAIGLLAFFQNTVPKEFGTKSFPALEQDVEVVIDDFGIPHINAKTDLDGYRALGYLMASERLYQLDLMRRVVNGRLSEIFGERTLESDILMRKLEVKKTALLHLENIKKTKKNLRLISYAEAFLEGIHHYIDTAPLPLEFILLNYVPEKFEVADILGVPSYMSLAFAEGLIGDLFLSEMLEQLPEEKMKLLRIGSSVEEKYFPKKVKNTEVEPETTLIKGMKTGLDQLMSVFPLFHGSNAWVLSGKRSKSGFPLLANDPHIATSKPHVFYEAHLKTPSIETYGNYLPLIPFPVMGNTLHSAWGITMSLVDDINVYSEKINPENPDQVMYKNEWTEISTRTEIIKIKGGAQKTIEIGTTPHGPLLDETKYATTGKTFSLSWSALNPESNILRCLYDMAQARKVSELKDALAYAAAPGLNIMWVNKSGDIAWWMVGKYPKFPDGVRTDVVLKGWDGSAEIERYYSIDENPHEVNPESGIIISANFKPQLEEFDHFQGYWQPAGRFYRLEKLLSSQEMWSIEEFKKIQTDSTFPVFEMMGDKLSSVIDKDKLTPNELKVLKEFEMWNGSTDITNTGSSIAHVFNAYIFEAVFKDELGEKGFKTFGRIADFWHVYKALVMDMQHSFWDNIYTDRVESGADIVTTAFKDTVAHLTLNYGPRSDLWLWGKLHTVEYPHSLGSVKPLNYLYNVGPKAASGSRYVINNQGHEKHLKTFKVVHGPATRRLVDMKNPESSQAIIPTGNSGNPFSKHYRDQLELYHSGKYRKQLMDWEILNKREKLILSSSK